MSRRVPILGVGARRRQEGGDHGLLRRLVALADPHRLAVVRLLMGRTEVGVGEIVALCGDISQPSVSRHLTVLYNVGIVDAQRRGQNVFYRLDPQVVAFAEQLAALAVGLGAAE